MPLDCAEEWAMEHADGIEASAVASLDDLAPAHLAALLRAVRNQRTQSRRDVARRVGTSVRALRRCERGDASVPRDLLAALASYYGDDLTGRFEMPPPIQVDQPRIVVGNEDVRPRLGGAPALPAAEPSALAVESLLAELALARLGTVLQSTREEHSNSRRDVASQVGTTARDLRRYETGAAPVPRGVLTALAEFYGDDLNTHFAHRNPVQVDPMRMVGGVEEAQVHSGDGDEALGAYLGILRRLPDPASDRPVTLRADDMAALSSALDVEPEHVKGRITELLARTTRLRRYQKVRRRKRILSGAGIGIAAATIAGFGTGAMVAALPSHADPLTITAAASSTTVAEPSTTVAQPSTTVAQPSTTVAQPTTVAEPATVPETTPATEPPTTTTFVAIGPPITVIAPPTTTTTTFPRPVITPDTTPMTTPATEPITIITNP
jgi:transcriptional regulator with XRE-family HTH domain